MINLTLIRTKSSDQGTLGQIVMPDKTILYTCELPYKDSNKDSHGDSNTSCIDPGHTYDAKFLWSPKHDANKYHILGVVGRDVIEMHSGNFGGDTSLKDSKGNQLYQSDILGCILLGRSIGILKNKFGNMQEAVESSVSAVTYFETYMKGEPFTLTITML